MAWTTPRCWTTGEVVTAAIMTTHVRDNFNVTAPAVLTTAGDILYASGSNVPARVAKGTNGNILHQASCAPAWTASPSFTGLTLSGALDVNGTIDYDGTDVDMLSSGDIDLVSSSNAAAAIYIAQSTGTSGTIKIHADTGTSVTEGAESINILSDVGGIGLRSTANLANAINLTVDGGTTSSMTLFNDQGTGNTEGSASIQLLSDAGGINIKSTADLAGSVRLTADGGTSETIILHSDQGTSVTEGAESISLLSDAGGIGLRSTANLANAINLTVDSGTTSSITVFNDTGTSVTEGAESISLLSDAGGVGIRSTANLANAVNITADGGTTSTIQIYNDQGTAVNEGVASIQLLSDVGGIGVKSGLNAAGAIRLTADAGTSETIILHADQGNGTGSICLTSDAGGITLNPGTFVTIGGIADGEIRLMEDSGAGTNYVAIKAQDMSASYTLTLPVDDGCCGEALTTNGSGTLTWASAGGGCVACDSSPQLAASLDAQTNTILNIGHACNDILATGIRVIDGTGSAPSYSFTGCSGTGLFRAGGNQIGFATGGDERARFVTREFHINDSANTFLTQGININQGAYDDDIMAFKSSDVCQPMVAQMEADTYGIIAKIRVTGGILIEGASECEYGVKLLGDVTTKCTAKTTSAIGPIMLAGRAHSSGSVSCVGTDGNILVVRSECTTNFIFDHEGTMHGNLATAIFDDQCDIELMRGFLAETVPCYRERFGRDMMYNLCHYTDMKLIGKDSVHWKKRDCGRWEQRAMINMSGLTMLHHSTIIQMHDNLKTVIQSQEQRITSLETQLALSEGN